MPYWTDEIMTIGKAAKAAIGDLQSLKRSLRLSWPKRSPQVKRQKNLRRRADKSERRLQSLGKRGSVRLEMPEIEQFMPEKGQVVTAQGHTGTFKVIQVSADGQTADIQPFSLSKQMLIGSVMGGIPCSTLFHFKEDPSQAAARIVREASED
jgi:hypothetical protein